MLSSEQRKSLESAADRYADHLELAMPYLAKRGLSRQSASSVGLGFVKRPTSDEPDLLPGHEKYIGRLSIPYVTRAGVIGFKFRCIKCAGDCVGHAKYLNTSGWETRFYNTLDLHEDTLDIHVAEGEFDTVTLSTLCGLPAVGIPGATNWKPWWKEILEDFRWIYVFCDSDSAGSGLGRKLQKELGRKVVLLEFDEPDMDVNSMYVKRGREFIRSMIPKESK
jgi:5S rRNA maturation endonuclease (ribonuclease M5)